MNPLLKDKHIDRDSSVPLYYQMKQILLEYLEQEHTDSSLPIPTEQSLSEDFGISRPTVRQAINELVVEGRLFRVKGKGTFVLGPSVELDFPLRVESYENKLRRKGMIPKTDVLKFTEIAADAKIAAALQLVAGDPVYELWRLRYADGRPMVFVITYLPKSLCPRLTGEDFKDNSLYNLLESRYGLKVDWMSRTLEASLAGEYEAGLLGISVGDPIQAFESIGYRADNTPLEYSFARYRGQGSRFYFKLAR